MSQKSALRESEERLRTIIEQSPISMAIVGLDGTIEYINRRAIETFGYLPEQFTEQGEIVVAVDRVAEETTEDAVTLLFSVTDTGIGIEADRLETVFEPFTQACESRSRLYGGAGLGLTIARRLVEMMGGRLRVESEPGKGSTFHFTVRFCRDAAGEGGEPAPAESSAPGAWQVLIVEDDPASRRLVEATLTRQGHRSVAAGTGTDALTLLEKRDFDLVLMDVQLPGLNGLDLTRRIRDRSSAVRNHDIPVVALTAMAMRGDEERCLQAGMDAYLSKPLNTEALSATMRRVLSRSAAVPPL